MFKLASLTLAPCSQKRPRCHTIAWGRAGLPTCPQTSCCEVLRPCSKALVVLFSLLCTYLVELELELQFHVHSEDLDCSWQRHMAYPFTLEQCVVFEVLGYRRTCIDVVIRPLGGRTGAAL